MAQKIKNHKTIKAKHQNGDFEMAYEIDFIGVNSEKSTKDADAICMRWRSGVSFGGAATYKIGVVDGGFEAHGDALVAHMNQYYFNDELNMGNSLPLHIVCGFLRGASGRAHPVLVIN